MMSGGLMPPGLVMGDLPFPDAREGGGTYPSLGGKYPKEQSVFFKTRPCVKFASGRCTLGDRCSYAHGDAELRPLPPEAQQILDRRGRGGQDQGIPGAPPSPLAHSESKGQCNYGDDCKFAHGPSELQGRDNGTRTQMDGAGFDPFRAMMMPGGPMLPPEFMMGGMMGMGGPMIPMAPRPPPGPPPPTAKAVDESKGTPGHSPVTDFGFDIQRTPARHPSEVAFTDRIKALCMILGVGPKRRDSIQPDATEAAIASIQTGEAFQGNAYSDSLEVAI